MNLAQLAHDKILFVFSEYKLQREHDQALHKLSDWKKRFQHQLDDAVRKVKEFASKDRPSEADKYMGELNDLSSKLEHFKEEVGWKHLWSFECFNLKASHSHMQSMKFFKEAV